MIAIRTLLPALLLLAATTTPASAWQPRPRPNPPSKAALEEARRHYKRALVLYEQEGDAEAALAELERAYDLAPSYKILYNLGQAARAAHQYATSLRALQRYLGDGAGEIPAARRSEVEDQLLVLQGFVAQLDVGSSAGGASLSIDDVVVGTLPFEQPLLVDGGRRTLRLTTRDGQTITRTLTVAGGDRLHVQLEPAPPAPLPTPAVTLLAPPPATTPPVDLPMRRGMPHAWAAWLATGALTASAAVTGGLALAAAGELKSAPYPNSASAASLRGLSDRVSSLGIATDVVGAAAVVTLGVALFVTLRKVELPRAQAAALRFDVGVAPRAISVAGRF